MTLKQISLEKRRLAEAYRSLITSRYMIIDSLDREYDRHLRLTIKKESMEDPKKILNDSLSKSRNMKKFQREMTDIKKLIRDNQTRCKNLKVLYKETEKNILRKNLKEEKEMLLA